MGQYKLPAICANCGTEQGTKPWAITNTSVSISPLTLLGMFFGIGLVNRKTFSFTIPVCDSCWEKFIQHEKMRRRLSIGCITIFLAGVILWVILAQTGRENALAYSIAVVLTVNIVLYIIYDMSKIKIATFNGTYFRFKNPTFFREFALLNPDLVKPSRRSDRNGRE